MNGKIRSESTSETCYLDQPDVQLDGKALAVVSEIEQELGIAFNNKALLLQAFIHKSFDYHHPYNLGNNERLEFLGDAILGGIVKEHLYWTTTEDEGGMTSISSYVLSNANLAGVSNRLRLYRWLIRDPVYMAIRLPSEKERCDVLEALIGAIFIDQGREAAKRFIITHVLPTAAMAKEATLRHPKARLQILTHRREKMNPQYIIDIAYERGEPVFLATVVLGRRVIGRGEGASKAQAKIAAAENALEKYETDGSCSRS